MSAVTPKTNSAASAAAPTAAPKPSISDLNAQIAKTAQILKQMPSADASKTPFRTIADDFDEDVQTIGVCVSTLFQHTPEEVQTVIETAQRTKIIVQTTVKDFETLKTRLVKIQQLCIEVEENYKYVSDLGFKFLNHTIEPQEHVTQLHKLRAQLRSYREDNILKAKRFIYQLDVILMRLKENNPTYVTALIPIHKHLSQWQEILSFRSEVAKIEREVGARLLHAFSVRAQCDKWVDENFTAAKKEMNIKGEMRSTDDATVVIAKQSFRLKALTLAKVNQDLIDAEQLCRAYKQTPQEFFDRLKQAKDKIAALKESLKTIDHTSAAITDRSQRAPNDGTRLKEMAIAVTKLESDAKVIQEDIKRNIETLQKFFSTIPEKIRDEANRLTKKARALRAEIQQCKVDALEVNVAIEKEPEADKKSKKEKSKDTITAVSDFTHRAHENYKKADEVVQKLEKHGSEFTKLYASVFASLAVANVAKYGSITLENVNKLQEMQSDVDEMAKDVANAELYATSVKSAMTTLRKVFHLETQLQKQQTSNEMDKKHSAAAAAAATPKVTVKIDPRLSVVPKINKMASLFRIVTKLESREEEEEEEVVVKTKDIKQFALDLRRTAIDLIAKRNSVSDSLIRICEADAKLKDDPKVRRLNEKLEALNKHIHGMLEPIKVAYRIYREIAQNNTLLMKLFEPECREYLSMLDTNLVKASELVIQHFMKMEEQIQSISFDLRSKDTSTFAKQSRQYRLCQEQTYLFDDELFIPIDKILMQLEILFKKLEMEDVLTLNSKLPEIVQKCRGELNILSFSDIKNLGINAANHEIYSEKCGKAEELRETMNKFKGKVFYFIKRGIKAFSEEVKKHAEDAKNRYKVFEKANESVSPSHQQKGKAVQIEKAYRAVSKNLSLCALRYKLMCSSIKFYKRVDLPTDYYELVTKELMDDLATILPLRESIVKFNESFVEE